MELPTGVATTVVGIEQRPGRFQVSVSLGRLQSTLDDHCGGG